MKGMSLRGMTSQRLRNASASGEGDTLSVIFNWMLQGSEGLQDLGRVIGSTVEDSASPRPPESCTYCNRLFAYQRELVFSRSDRRPASHLSDAPRLFHIMVAFSISRLTCGSFLPQNVI